MATTTITIDPAPSGVVVLVFDVTDNGEHGRTTIEFSANQWVAFVVTVLRAVPVYNVGRRP
jgi:hypothetical protein